MRYSPPPGMGNGSANNQTQPYNGHPSYNTDNGMAYGNNNTDDIYKLFKVDQFGKPYLQKFIQNIITNSSFCYTSGIKDSIGEQIVISYSRLYICFAQALIFLALEFWS